MTDKKLEIYAKVWNFMRCTNEAALAHDGYELIREMCQECVEKRESACEKCLALHKKLDHVEAAMPRNILMEPFKFERTIKEQTRLRKVSNCHCDHQE